MTNIIYLSERSHDNQHAKKERNHVICKKLSHTQHFTYIMRRRMFSLNSVLSFAKIPSPPLTTWASTLELLGKASGSMFLAHLTLILICQKDVWYSLHTMRSSSHTIPSSSAWNCCEMLYIIMLLLYYTHKFPWTLWFSTEGHHTRNLFNLTSSKGHESGGWIKKLFSLLIYFLKNFNLPE